MSRASAPAHSFNRALFAERRAALGLSLERLAQRASLSVHLVGSVSRGLTPGPDARQRLAAALCTDVASLFPLEPAARSAVG